PHPQRCRLHHRLSSRHPLARRGVRRLRQADCSSPARRAQCRSHPGSRAGCDEGSRDMSGDPQPGKMRLRLPATSANLGPGFDAAAVALDFYLHIEAERAGETSIIATGRDAERCARLEDNLVLDLYRDLLPHNGRPAIPLAIRMQNEIPLGMGCGSSAAGRLAAIALANHFGGLGWDGERILAEASALEGHPDNAAACWLGGFVAAAENSDGIHVARVIPPAEWRAIVVLPNEPLATSK